MKRYIYKEKAQRMNFPPLPVSDLDPATTTSQLRSGFRTPVHASSNGGDVSCLMFRPRQCCHYPSQSNPSSSIIWYATTTTACSNILVLSPMPRLPNLLKLRLPNNASPRTLLAPKAAKQSCESTALAGREAVVRVLLDRGA